MHAKWVSFQIEIPHANQFRLSIIRSRLLAVFPAIRIERIIHADILQIVTPTSKPEVLAATARRVVRKQSTSRLTCKSYSLQRKFVLLEVLSSDRSRRLRIAKVILFPIALYLPFELMHWQCRIPNARKYSHPNLTTSTAAPPPSSPPTPHR